MSFVAASFHVAHCAREPQDGNSSDIVQLSPDTRLNTREDFQKLDQAIRNTDVEEVQFFANKSANDVQQVVEEERLGATKAQQHREEEVHAHEVVTESPSTTPTFTDEEIDSEAYDVADIKQDSDKPTEPHSRPLTEPKLPQESAVDTKALDREEGGDDFFRQVPRHQVQLDAAVQDLAGVATNAKELAHATHEKLGKYRQAIQKLHEPLHSLAREAAELRSSLQSMWKAGEEERLASWRDLDSKLLQGDEANHTPSAEGA